MSATPNQVVVVQSSDGAPRIPRPDGVRPPLKANVFRFASGTSAQLQPMFPYESAGNLVPCVAVMQGIDDGQYGHFFHRNSVEEIAVVFGSNNAMLATGAVFATQPLHGVNSFLKDPTDPEAYVLITITQRQTEEGDQSEAVLFRCQKCSHELVHFKYNSTPRDVAGHDPSQWGGDHDDAVSMFPTLWGSAEAAEQYNADEASRTCSECGHVNPEFPLHLWGWKRWLTQQRTVNAAKLALEAAAHEVQPGEQPVPAASAPGAGASR